MKEGTTQMSLMSRGRPSPAMIVAAVALCFALAGTAIAADPVSKITKSKVKSIARKQADKQLKANVSGSHVNEADHAKNADNATNAANATNATNATNAQNANNAANLGGQAPGAYQNRVRWVLVSPAGAILAQSGGITVTRTGVGAYLVNFGVATAGKALLGSSSIAGDNTFRGSIEAVPCTNAPPEGLPGACPAVNANQARFFISNPANTANQDHSFYATLLP
jgi:hypothetical protein